MTKHKSKPVIETLINTAAIALTSYGVLQATTGNYTGYLAIVVAVGLEMLKYWGRSKDLW